MTRRALRPALTALLVAVSSLAMAAAPDPLQPTLEGARLVDMQQLDGELYHVQGVELDGARIWVTSVDNATRRGYLHQFDRASGRLRRRIELTDGVRYHPGGLSKTGGSLWVPVAEMRPDSSALLVEIDAETLQVRRRIRMSDHLGCVAAAGDMLVAGNWDSRTLYVIDLAGKAPVRAMPNPSPTHYQDMKLVGDRLVAGGNRSWLDGSVDWIDWRTMTLERSLPAGAIGRVRPFGRGGPLTGEGMAIDGSDLYLLPEDGPSRLFHFRLDD